MNEQLLDAIEKMVAAAATLRERNQEVYATRLEMWADSIWKDMVDHAALGAT